MKVAGAMLDFTDGRSLSIIDTGIRSRRQKKNLEMKMSNCWTLTEAFPCKYDTSGRLGLLKILPAAGKTSRRLTIGSLMAWAIKSVVLETLYDACSRKNIGL